MEDRYSRGEALRRGYQKALQLSIEGEDIISSFAAKSHEHDEKGVYED